MSRQAYIEITNELIHDVLALPGNVRIRSFQIHPSLDGITAILEGEGLPDRCETREGDTVMQVASMFEESASGRVAFEGWMP